MPHLYDPELRPSRTTYQIILRICSETIHPSEYELAVDVATKVYRRTILNDIVPEAAELALKCCLKLPKDSEKRQLLEALVQSTLSTSEQELVEQAASQ
jgi:hypothetical protein